RVQTNIISNLHDATVSLGDGSLALEHLQGEIQLAPNMVALHSVSGLLSGAPFSVSGTEQLKPSIYDIHFHSTHTDLQQANALLKLLKVKQPLLSLLGGRAADVRLSLTGSAANPIMSLSTLPESINFRIWGSDKRVTITSGRVT